MYIMKAKDHLSSDANISINSLKGTFLYKNFA